jgi:glycerol dehydrogenase-like iron-containing ADH family enzyme
MRIRRPTIIISAILASGVALAALAGSEMSAAARHAPSTHVEVVDTSPNIMFHG